MLKFFHTSSAQWVEISPQSIAEVYTKCDEVLWYDTHADGQRQGFDLSVFKSLDIELNRTIIRRRRGKRIEMGTVEKPRGLLYREPYFA